MGGNLLKPQTTAQILRCFTLGSYTVRVEDEELKIQGPQPLAGPLPESIKANRRKLIRFLVRECGGVWPPAKDSRCYSSRRRRLSAEPTPEVSEKRKRFHETLRKAALSRRGIFAGRREGFQSASPPREHFCPNGNGGSA